MRPGFISQDPEGPKDVPLDLKKFWLLRPRSATSNLTMSMFVPGVRGRASRAGADGDSCKWQRYSDLARNPEARVTNSLSEQSYAEILT